MTNVASTAAAGLHRAAQTVERAARHIANVNTPGYRTRQADSAEAPRTRQPAPPRSDPPLRADPPEAQREEASSDVDLAKELVELKRGETAYGANAAVIRTADRMRGELLDLVG